MRTRVVIADGAMGTMLQAANPTLDDYQDLEGCNEILNVTRPDMIAAIHDAYLEIGIDAIETNTFGANWSNLSDYGIDDRIRELAREGAAIARERVGRVAGAGRPHALGARLDGPGHQAAEPRAHHVRAPARTRSPSRPRASSTAARTRCLIETSQDLLQTKAAVNGCKQAIVDVGHPAADLRRGDRRDHRHHAHGQRDRRGAHRARAARRRRDRPELRDRPGRDERAPAAPVEARRTMPVVCMPNAGLPVLGPHGASYPLTPEELATAHEQFVREFGLGLVGGCCGTTPEHMRLVVEAHRRRCPVAEREPVRGEPGVASLYQHVIFDQERARTSRSASAPTRTGRRRSARRCSTSAGTTCVDIARNQIRDGAHLLDVCVDYVGRDGVADMREVVSRLASASTLPLVIDSTEPAVLPRGPGAASAGAPSSTR